MHSTAKVLVCIVQLCYEAKKWTLLNENIVMLTKKRSQLKQAVAKMVQECCKWISEGTLPSKDVELELINTLRTVTEGKIYVEVERARLTHRLAKMKVILLLLNHKYVQLKTCKIKFCTVQYFYVSCIA